VAAMKRLAEVLVEGGWVTADRLQEAVDRGLGGSNLARHLVDAALLTEDDLAQARARQYGLPYLDLIAVDTDVDLLRRLPPALLKSGACFPFRRGDGQLAVAVSDPGDLPLLDELRLCLGETEVAVASPSQIRATLEGAETAARILQEISQDFQLALVTEADEAPLSLDRVKEDQSPIIKLVDSIILHSIERRASDVHLEGTERHLTVKYRIDGTLYPAMEPLDRRYQ
jgi:type IV pilus assembly protein PilB